MLFGKKKKVESMNGLDKFLKKSFQELPLQRAVEFASDRRAIDYAVRRGKMYLPKIAHFFRESESTSQREGALDFEKVKTNVRVYCYNKIPDRFVSDKREKPSPNQIILGDNIFASRLINDGGKREITYATYDFCFLNQFGHRIHFEIIGSVLEKILSDPEKISLAVYSENLEHAENQRPPYCETNYNLLVNLDMLIPAESRLAKERISDEPDPETGWFPCSYYDYLEDVVRPVMDELGYEDIAEKTR